MWARIGEVKMADVSERIVILSGLLLLVIAGGIRVWTPVLGAHAIQIGRDFLAGEGLEAGTVLSIDLVEKEPNFYWDYSLKFDRPDLTELRKCHVIKYEPKQRPGHFFEVWIDASEHIVVGGTQCR